MQKMGHLILPKTGHLSVPLTLSPLERFHRRNFPKKERPGEHTDSQGAAFPIKLPTKIFYHMTAASRMLDILSSLIADALALLITHTVRLAPVHINTSHDCRHSLPPSCAPVAASVASGSRLDFVAKLTTAADLFPCRVHIRLKLSQLARPRAPEFIQRPAMARRHSERTSVEGQAGRPARVFLFPPAMRKTSYSTTARVETF